MGTGYFLDSSMIERSRARSINQRAEERLPPTSETAVLDYRGRRHVVRLGNVSASGAMVIFAHVPNIGENVTLQLLDRGRIPAQVRWVGDGRIGLSFCGQHGEALEWR